MGHSVKGRQRGGLADLSRVWDPDTVRVEVCGMQAETDRREGCPRIFCGVGGTQ